MAKIENIVDALSAMTVLEVVQLAKALEDTWGVDAAPVTVAELALAARPAHVNKNDYCVEYRVELMNAGEKKVDVIKLVRELTGLGLREATALVEAAPTPVKENLWVEDAKAMKKKLEEAGATVEIK